MQLFEATHVVWIRGLERNAARVGEFVWVCRERAAVLVDEQGDERVAFEVVAGRRIGDAVLGESVGDGGRDQFGNDSDRAELGFEDRHDIVGRAAWLVVGAGDEVAVQGVHIERYSIVSVKIVAGLYGVLSANGELRAGRSVRWWAIHCFMHLAPSGVKKFSRWERCCWGGSHGR